MYRGTQLAYVTILVLLLVIRPLAAEEPPADVLLTDSFESGKNVPSGWKQGPAVPGVEYVYDHGSASDGQRSLSLHKTANRYFPIASWSQVLQHKGDKPALHVSAKVKASKASKAVIDVLFLDAKQDWIKHEWVAYIGQKEPSNPLVTHGWKTYSGSVEIPDGTRQIGIAFQIYGPGRVWLDELEVRYADSATKPDDAKTSGEPSRPHSQIVSERETLAPIEVRLDSGGVARYLLIPAHDTGEQPMSGYPLLLIVPGGDGSADFHPFVRRIHEEALDGRFVVAQPLAPPQTVWPTGSSIARQVTTEASIEAIVDDVSRRHPIKRQQVYALAWSSSGPAIYSALLQEQSSLAGAFIAMSVFKPDQLPPLSHAADRRIYLLHSPEDAICPYHMAQQAEEQLTRAGADVRLVDYEGGHGWHGPVYSHIRAGMEWLIGSRAFPRDALAP